MRNKVRITETGDSGAEELRVILETCKGGISVLGVFLLS